MGINLKIENMRLLGYLSLVCLALVCSSTVALLTLAPTAKGEFASTSVSLPPMNLTLVAANGTRLVLHSGDIGSLLSVRGYGAYKNTLGSIRGIANYTGVPISTLCNLVGGLTENDGVMVTAEDGYNVNLTAAQLGGEFMTFDPLTSDAVQQTQPLTPIIAYYKNDVNITSDDGGPLRLVIVSPENLATNSTLWVKYVIQVEILSGVVPEFSSPLTIVLMIALASSAVLAGKGDRVIRHNVRRDGRRNS
jgi:hypothetical protein